MVHLAFLAISSNFQIVTDAVDYFFGLNDKVNIKDRPLARLDPVHRCMIAMAIQSFERCHPEALLINVVVRELNQRQTLVPFVRVVQYTCSEHILKNLICPLRLTISLWMRSRDVDQMHPHVSMQLFPEASDELWPSVRNDCL
jgi:hypothetical protein